jgi:DNA-binding NtrC family response regulator
MAHILVIDDEESILFTFGRFLTTEEHEVTLPIAIVRRCHGWTRNILI